MIRELENVALANLIGYKDSQSFLQNQGTYFTLLDTLHNKPKKMSSDIIYRSLHRAFGSLTYKAIGKGIQMLMFYFYIFHHSLSTNFYLIGFKVFL